MPFTVDQFFEVFAAYNSAIWPAQIAAYVLAAVTLGLLLAGHRWRSRSAAALLGLLWMWNGLAYHLMFFSPINPAAYLFAALFVAQGLAFLMHGIVRNGLDLAFRGDWRGIAALIIIAYAAVVYEVLGSLAGRGWPRAPQFGVAPCPTTIFTFGFLMLTTRPIPLWLLVVPVGWAAVGSTAALLLAVPEDLGMLVAALAGVALLPRWGFRRLLARA